MQHSKVAAKFLQRCRNEVCCIGCYIANARNSVGSVDAATGNAVIRAFQMRGGGFQPRRASMRTWGQVKNKLTSQTRAWNPDRAARMRVSNNWREILVNFSSVRRCETKYSSVASG